MKLVRSGCPINFGVKGYNFGVSVALRSNARGGIWIHLPALDGKVQVSQQGKVSTLVGNMTKDAIVNSTTFAIS